MHTVHTVHTVQTIISHPGPAKIVGYLTLKTVSTIATLPILSAVLLDTVQSESARADSATPMSCLKDAIYRFTGSGSSYQYRLLLPVHQLIIPTGKIADFYNLYSFCIF